MQIKPGLPTPSSPGIQKSGIFKEKTTAPKPKLTPSPLDRLQLRSEKPVSKAELVSRMLVENAQIKPNPAKKQQIIDELCAFPAGCLKLLSKMGNRIVILASSQSIRAAGVIKPLNPQNFLEAKSVKTIRKKAAEAMAKPREGKENPELEIYLDLAKATAEEIQIAFLDQKTATCTYFNSYRKPVTLPRGETGEETLTRLVSSLSRPQSAEQLKELVEVAKALNPESDSPFLLLPDYQFRRDPDGETRRYKTEDLSLMKDWSRAAGMYRRQERTVILKENMLDGIVTARAAGNTSLHEAAHALDYAVETSDPDYYREFDALAQAKFRQFQAEPEKMISPNCLSGLNEFKAEGIAALMGKKKDRLEKLDPEWYHAVKNLVKRADRLGEAADSSPA